MALCTLFKRQEGTSGQRKVRTGPTLLKRTSTPDFEYRTMFTYPEYYNSLVTMADLIAWAHSVHLPLLPLH